MWNFENGFLHNRATEMQLFIKQNLSVNRIQAIVLLWSLLMSFKTWFYSTTKRIFTYCINCLYLIFDMLTGHLVIFMSFIYCHARLHFIVPVNFLICIIFSVVVKLFRGIEKKNERIFLYLWNLDLWLLKKCTKKWGSLAIHGIFWHLKWLQIHEIGYMDW